MLNQRRTSKKNIESAILESLMLLNINLTEKSEKLFINESIFIKLTHKDGVHILHFLFTLIDNDKATKIFRNFWPILDMKQDAGFRHAAYEWFKEMNQKETFKKRVVVSSIACVTPGSPKFLQTILSLLHHALYSIIVCKDVAVLMPATCSQGHNVNRKIKRILRRLKKFHATKYVDESMKRRELLHQLNQRIIKFEDEYQNLAKKEELLQEEIFQINEQTADDLQTEIIKKNSEICSLWGMVVQFKKTILSSYSTIEALIENGTLSTMDGNILLDSIKATNCNTDCLKNGQLDVVSVVRNSIPILKEIENQSEFSFGTEIKTVEIKEQLSSTDKSIEQIRADISGLNSSLNLSIRLLHKQTEKIPNCKFNDHFKESVALCPPTPTYLSKRNPRESLMKTYQLFSLTPDKIFMNKSFNRTQEKPLSNKSSIDKNSFYHSHFKNSEDFTFNMAGSYFEESVLKKSKFVCNKPPLSSPSIRIDKSEKESLQSLLERMNTLIHSPIPVKEETLVVQSLKFSSSKSNRSKIKRTSFNNSSKYIDIFEASSKTSSNDRSFDIDPYSLHSLKPRQSTELFPTVESNVNNEECEETFRNLKSVNFELDRFSEESKYLPSHSLYNTAVESLVAGELADEVVNDEVFLNAVRRETLHERRSSILSLRASISNSPMFSELITMSTSDNNLLDESDSCLVTSFEA